MPAPLSRAGAAATHAGFMFMKTEVVDVSTTRKELKIEIDAADVRAEMERVTERYAAAVNVPGFRKGRAPNSVVRQRYKNEIRGEVVQNLVPHAINEAINETALNVIGEPDIHLSNDEALEKLGEQPLSIHAHVEVLPEVALGEYKGLEVVRRTRPVTDETVAEMIENLREQSASLQPVEDRAAEAGDTVTVNFTGKYIEPAEAEDIKADDVDVVIGGEGVLEDFTEQLTGTKPDDVKTFRVSYPENFSSPGLAGKVIDYTATVTAVRRKELPEVDDEWAKTFGEEIDSLETLRSKLRESLEDRARLESEHRLRDELMGKLLTTHEFDVPESLVKSQARRLLESTVRDMMQRGMDPRNQELDWGNLQGMMEAQATEDLRGSILLERIADAEEIEPTDEEIEREIESLAQGARQTVEQVRAALTKQGGERSIADRLRHRKALDLLMENARVSEEEWREDAPPAEAAPEAAPEADAAQADETNAGGESPSGEAKADDE
ncbi:MAG TPA: trigger factor [Pyrinomonadaceae bacterium]|jgi:trigger factor|nr:trigger factor [Pyrinomonadaceae bacterium]